MCLTLLSSQHLSQLRQTMRDASGKKITVKEFMTRWKEGIQNVNQFQQTKINLFGYWIMIAGLLIGIITSIMSKVWWLVIVLSGSLIVTGVSTFVGIQKYLIFKDLEMQLKGGVENDNKEQDQKDLLYQESTI